MGLPSETFLQFAELLRVASSGAVTCVETQGGICSLPSLCSAYPNLWDFTFKVSWGQDLWAIMSIETFASDANGFCEIFIEYQDNTSTKAPAQTKRINFGTMFFFAFNLQSAVDSDTQIWVNNSTLSSISDIVDPAIGPNPFVVTPAALATSPATQNSYLPAFEVTLGQM